MDIVRSILSWYVRFARLPKRTITTRSTRSRSSRRIAGPSSSAGRRSGRGASSMFRLGCFFIGGITWRSALRRHRRGVTLPDRFWSKIDKNGSIPEACPERGPCWLWTASCDGKGYGKFYLDGKLVPAHRLAFEDRFGPVEPSLDIDHLCRVHACCNPDHHEPVTRRENLLRGRGPSAKHAAMIRCVRGHPFDAENTKVMKDKHGYEHRRCRECLRLRKREAYAKRVRS